MNDWSIGYALGIATGLAIGLVAARRQKRWSEMSSTEKKLQIGIIALGIALLIAGIVTMLVV